MKKDIQYTAIRNELTKYDIFREVTGKEYIDLVNLHELLEGLIKETKYPYDSINMTSNLAHYLVTKALEDLSIGVTLYEKMGV